MTPLHCIALIWFLALTDGVFAGPLAEESEWRERYPVDGDTPVLVVRNIWGPISVRTGPPGDIQVSVRTRFSAPGQHQLETARSVFAVAVNATPNGVELRVGDAYRWQRRGGLCRRCMAKHEFDVVVPASASVDVATVNDGAVRVSGVKGRVSASNVNGAVSIEAASACDNVESVNGDVAVEFDARPRSACNVETVNGDVRVGVPGGSDLDVALDLSNGRVRSDFDVSPFATPAVVEKSGSDGEHRYRVSKAAGVRIGRGGPLFTIASLNGDVTLVKIP